MPPAIRRSLYRLSVIALVAFLPACGPPSAESEEAVGDARSAAQPPSAVTDTVVTDTVVTDALGRSVRFQHPVSRLVSLAPNLTEIAFAAGGGRRLVAGTRSDDFPPPVDTLPKISALPVDFEAIAAQRPGLVVATDQVNAPRAADTFDALDLPVYFFSFEQVGDVFDGIRQMGRLLGTASAAADSAAALEASFDALQARTDDLGDGDRPRVLVLIGDETLYAFGGSSYVHTLVEAAGGRSITADLEASAPTLSEEYVLEQRPDVIVGAWGGDYDPGRLERLHPTWDVVPAVASGRVYSLDPDFLLRPGPRLVDGAWAIARHLHPSRFAPSAGPLPSPPPRP